MEHDFIIINSDNESGDSNVVRQGPIARALRTQSGRAALAASMANPIRTNLRYADIARKVFLVEAMPPGALPTYVRPPDDEDAP